MGCSNRSAWSTASEKRFSHFEVERSLDGRSFSLLGKVLGHSNPSGCLIYLDQNNETTAYYRLKMVDMDGSSDYSKIVETTNDCRGKTVSIFPDPYNMAVYSMPN